jgi:thiol:disulfide interchange protein/DsbC/DsbD-like thiol-disulfide interchange protein
MNSLRISLRPYFAALLTATSAVFLPAVAQVSSSLPTSAGPVVTTSHVRAELVAHAPQGVAAGAPVWVGLQITHQPGWHTYWKNAGDSGLPTELQWTLPPGAAGKVTIGDTAWPVPQKIRIGALANYGYEGTVLLPVPVTVAADYKPDLFASGASGAGELEVRLKASWLVCRQECIPEEGSFALKLPIKSTTAFHQTDFDAAFAAQPATLTQPGRVEVVGNTLKIDVDGLPAAVRGKSLEFFPETGEVIHNGAVLGTDWTQAWTSDGHWTATLPLDAQRSASPRTMPIVLALAASDRQVGQPVAWRTDAPVTGNWPAAAVRATVSPALSAALASNAAVAAGTLAVGAANNPVGSPSFVLALLGALLGGLLLNLMPCVFPVLAIKVLGFARQAGNRSAHRKAGLSYTAGVMVSVLALAGAMLALRAAGTELGWGFQLQSPIVVAALAALFTLIGLNLMGMFEFGLMPPSSICTAEARHPLANDFLSGVLAVVISSPCSAPFMGASLGLAISLPAVEALLLFAALGLGLALPYLLASFVPAIAMLLPRPGAWMGTLRRLLAFPMFATVAWLVWVLGQQSGIDGAGALLALLVCLAAVVWSFTLRGRTRMVLATVLIATTAALTGAIGHNVIQLPPTSGVAAQSDSRWQPWSAARATELAAAGRPVFIDFTAAWCVTCQYNKKATLADPAVLADFDGKGVAMLRADWTRRDPAITAALAALGRNGVPVYVLQAPGKPPVVLTEILGKTELRAALASL